MSVKTGKSTAPNICQVVHADDHEMFRMGLRKLLEDRKDMRISASVDGGALVETLKTKPCDVVLLDLSMPDADGLELIRFIREAYPAVHVIALTMHKDREYFRAAMARGVHGYVLKDDVFDTLIDAIKTVFSGEKYYSSVIKKMMVEEYEMRQNAADSVHLLSPKEQEVLRMIAKGMMNKEIASKLFLSVRTVESHRAKIMRKLRISNVQGLVKFAIDHAMM